MSKKAKIVIVLIVMAFVSVYTISILQKTSIKRSDSVIKVGVLAPLSGPAGSMGESMVKSFKLGNLKSIQIFVEDDQCSAKLAISAYNKLRTEGVRVFVVGCSGSVLALAPIAKKNGDLILTSYAGSSEIRKTGDEVVRFIPDAFSVVDSIVGYLKRNQNDKYAILYEKQDYANSVREGIEEGYFKERSNLLVGIESYASDSTDIRTQISKIKSKSPTKIIFIPTSAETARTVLKQMQELNVKVDIVGEVNVCEFPFSPKDFGFKSVCFNALLSEQQLSNFQGTYKKTYGSDSLSPFYDAVTYDIGIILDRYFAQNKIEGDYITNLKNYILAGVGGNIIDSYTFTEEGVVNAGKYLTEVAR